jgi:hypothetical protein
MARDKKEARSDADGEEQSPQRAKARPAKEAQNNGPAGAGGKKAPDDQVLQREIKRALQPVMVDVQQQMARVVQEQIDEALHLHGKGEQESRGEDGVRAPVPIRPPEEKRAPEQKPPTEERAAQPVTADGQTGLSDLLTTSSGVLRQEGRVLIRAILSNALDTLFSNELRQSIQRQVERGLKPAVQVGLQAVPNPTVRQELQQQVETTLQAVVREALDAIFSTETRTELETHLNAALDALLQGDVETARSQLERGVRLLVQRILNTVQRYRDQLPRLLTRILLIALQGALASVEKQKAITSPGTGDKPEVAKAAA